MAPGILRGSGVSLGPGEIAHLMTRWYSWSPPEARLGRACPGGWSLNPARCVFVGIVRRERTFRRGWLEALGAMALLFLAAMLIHALVPEPHIADHHHPAVGDVVINQAVGERVVFREVPSAEGAQATVIDVYLDPHGAVPVAHVHPATDEVFRVVKGKVRMVVDGEARLLGPGESVRVPAGQSHVAENPHDTPAQVQVEMSPTGGLHLALTQVHGFLDETGKQGGLGEFLQMLRFAERYEVYRGDMPIWFQQLGIALLAPIARVLGFRSFYASYSDAARSRNTHLKDAQ